MTEEMSNKYTDDVGDDVRAAMTEVAAATPEPKPVKAEPEPAKAEPEVVDKSVKAEERTEEKPQGDRDRDEKGRFALKTEAKDEPKPEVKAETVDRPLEAKPVQPQPEAKPLAVAPPPGWSIKAKAHWDKLPQEVRDDIAKREADINKGFSEYQGFRGFIERAKREGQDPAQVLNNLVGFEQLIRSDPRSGILRIAQNLGWTQHQAGQHFATWAQELGFAPQGQMAPANQNGSGGSLADQNAGADPIALRQVLDPFVSPLMQRIQQLENGFQTYQSQAEAQESQRLRSTIEQFRQNPKYRYFDDVREEMAKLFRGGSVPEDGDLAANLADAYERACWQNPEVRQILIDERTAKLAEEKAKAAKEAADKSRQASKSVTGSPSPGASSPKPNGRGDKSYDDDLHDDVREAVRAASALA